MNLINKNIILSIIVYRMIHRNSLIITTYLVIKLYTNEISTENLFLNSLVYFQAIGFFLIYQPANYYLHKKYGRLFNNYFKCPWVKVLILAATITILEFFII